MRKTEISIALQDVGILFWVGGWRVAGRRSSLLAGVAPVIVRFGRKPPRRSVKEASSLGGGGRIRVKLRTRPAVAACPFCRQERTCRDRPLCANTCSSSYKHGGAAEDLAHHLLDREIPRCERGEFDTKLAQVNASTLLAAKSAFRRKLGCLPQRLNQTALVSYALARDIEGCTMIDRSTDHRQADRDVNAGLQSQYLDRAMALIMVHRNDHV